MRICKKNLQISFFFCNFAYGNSENNANNVNNVNYDDNDFNLYPMKKHLLLLTLASWLLVPAYAGVGKYVGGDISALPLYEAANTKYKDVSGTKIADLIPWLHQTCGWNTFRVRIFVNPKKMANDGKTADPQVCQDLAYVKKLGKRIKDEGCYFMLDFHYSDTWVDATHIQAPAAWDTCTAAQKADSVAAYTAMVLDALNAYGATPDMVQVGNEIMYGMCGIAVHPYNNTADDWTGFTNLLKAGCNVVRQKCPNAEIILHTDRPGNISYNNFWYGRMATYGVDYDVIGLSYYPFWHGTLTTDQGTTIGKSVANANLQEALASLATTFPAKKVQIVESAYYFQWWPTSGINYNTQTLWACSVAGQYQFVADLIDFLADYPQVEGYNYWMPEEAGNGDSKTVISSWISRGLWASTSGNHTINKKSSTQYAHLKMKDFLAPDTTTAVNEYIAPVRATKALVNGKMVIEKGGERYDVMGRKL